MVKKAQVAQGKFWSIIHQKRINVCHHNAFPYATSVLQISKMYGWSRQILKKSKKKKTLLPKLSMPVIWARYDLQLNYLIGRNFDIHPPTFSMDGCFPLYYPLFYALGSFSSQNFCRFNPTLAGPILDQAGPSRILLNWSDSPASVVRVMAQPASGQLRVWQKKKKNNTTNDRKRSTGFK